MWENNIPKWDVDSVMVPFGYQIELFDTAAFSGNSEVVKGKPYFEGDREMMPCQNLGPLKDDVGSARVSRNNDLNPAIGYWEGITHTESIDVSYKIGFDYSKSTQDRETQEFTMGF